MSEVWAAMAAGVLDALSWPACGALVAGVAVGAVVGLLPGIGGPAMLAMLLPFTLALTPLSAFALLMGAVSVLSTTGDLSSILFGVPGEAVSAALVVDGHAMARKGEAGRAMGAALMSSFIGAVFGAVALAAAIPVARPLLLTIGSPELFMLSIVGIMFMAPLVGRAPLKGLIAGAFGLWLATIGLDPIGGEPRYTGGALFLWDGIGLLPVVLGLFAVPEALTLASGSSRGGTAPLPARVEGVASGVREALRRWRLVLQCSAIGSYVGMLPGTGGAVAQWIAYAHAVSGRTAAGDRRGRIEGVLGPGAANNSTIGAALVPTLMFGIPGSVTSVVLLSALVMKGVVPGNMVLRPEAEGGHLAFVFSLVAFLVVANALVVGVSLPMLGRLSRLAAVRGTLLFPTVIVLTAVGAFMEKNAIEDLLVVAAAGALGVIMVRLDWPRPPLLLGLALGPLAENRLFLSTSLYGWTWWHRPGVLIIGVVAAVVLWRGIARRPSPDAGSTADVMSPMAAATSPTARLARRRREDTALLAAVVIAAVAALAVTFTWSFDARAALFPRLALVVIIALALAQALVRRQMDAAVAETSAAADRGAAFWMGGFFAAIWMLGFPAGTALATLAYLRLAAGERWIVAALYAGLVFAFVAGVLGRLLLVPLPEGLLMRLLSP